MRSLPEDLHARYEHCRNYNLVQYPGGEEPSPLPCGGTTRCWIENKENIAIVVGYATCSDTEQYNKKIGRAISLGRALKNLEEHNRMELG